MFEITDDQGQALVDVLRENLDGEPVQFTFEGGRLIVGFELHTVTIYPDGSNDSN
jgi:hypothetical protein